MLRARLLPSWSSCRRLARTRTRSATGSRSAAPATGAFSFRTRRGSAGSFRSPRSPRQSWRCSKDARLRSGPSPSDDAVAELRELDRRLSAIHRARGWTLAAVVFTTPRARRAAAARGGPRRRGRDHSLALALVVRRDEIVWVLIAGMVALTAGLACVGAARRSLIPLVVTGFFAGYLAVLAISPETNALAVLGARPDGGGRFYGVTNQVETLLLAPLLAAAAIGGRRWLVPLGVLALVTVGWSKAGADGGGIAVYATALAVARLASELRPSDAAARARRSGRRCRGRARCCRPRRSFRWVEPRHARLSVRDRILSSAISATGSTSAGRSLTKDAAQHRALRRLHRRHSCGWQQDGGAARRCDAMLVALAVSLLVNDTPVDVVGFGSLGCVALFRWESVDSRPHAPRSHDRRIAARRARTDRLRRRRGRRPDCRDRRRDRRSRPLRASRSFSRSSAVHVTSSRRRARLRRERSAPISTSWPSTRSVRTSRSRSSLESRSSVPTHTSRRATRRA